MKYSIRKNEIYGFKQLDPIPSKSDLAEFYATQYYPKEALNISDVEKKYIRLEVMLALLTIKKICSEHSALDLGCGPGFFSRELKSMGWGVSPCDYAQGALEANTPELLPNFCECDIEEYVKTCNATFGLVNLQNVLEHLRAPIEFLLNVKRLMTSNSVLRVKVPNDFSLFQQLLVSEGYSDATWISAPDHINYFNYPSLTNTLKTLGFKILSIQADFPVEVFLLNQHSNYAKKKNLGREAHIARLSASNYLMKKDMNLYKRYSEIAAELEYGRQLTAYASK